MTGRQRPTGGPRGHGLTAIRLGVVPGAPWAAQVGALAHRLRAVLENHPGGRYQPRRHLPVSITASARCGRI